MGGPQQVKKIGTCYSLTSFYVWVLGTSCSAFILNSRRTLREVRDLLYVNSCVARS